MTNHTAFWPFFSPPPALLYSLGKIQKENWGKTLNWVKEKSYICIQHLLIMKIHFLSCSYIKNWRTRFLLDTKFKRKDGSLTTASRKSPKRPQQETAVQNLHKNLYSVLYCWQLHQSLAFCMVLIKCIFEMPFKITILPWLKCSYLVT